MTQSENEADHAKAKETMASMADIKTLETTLTSSMNVKFDELRDLLTKLTNAKVSELIPLEGVSNSNEGDSEEDKEKKKKGVETTSGTKPPPPPSTVHVDGKEEYHAVSGWYPLDPPITTRINPLGPPPQLKDRKSTRLNSSHSGESRMPSSA